MLMLVSKLRLFGFVGETSAVVALQFLNQREGEALFVAHLPFVGEQMRNK